MYRKSRTKKQLRAFLGVVIFYSSYMEILAEETAVLTPATSRRAPNTVAWTSEMDQAFCNICGIVSMSSELVIPVANDVLSLVSDASRRGLDAIVQVEREGQRKAAAFYS